MLALISEFQKSVSDGKNNESLKNLKKFGIRLLKKSVPAALKLLTHGLLNLDQIRLDEFAKEELKNLSGSFGELEFEEYTRVKEAKQQFKEALRAFQREQNKPIIFFVDELDRCRPSFAVEMLERIKHLFDIENCTFILSIDKTQLKTSIKTLYGQDMDANGYIRRFIDLEYMLPEPDRNIFLDDLFGYYNMRNENTKFLELCLKEYVQAFDLSLRDIEKLMYYMSLLFPLTPFKNEAKYRFIYLVLMSVIYAFFPVLRFVNSEKFYRFLSNPNETNIEETKRVPTIGKSSGIEIEAHSLLSEVLAYKSFLQQERRGLSSRIIGNRNSPDNYFDLSELVDPKTREFHFVRQMQFLESFQIG